MYEFLVQFLQAISGRDRKSRSRLDRCAPVFRGSNECVFECVNGQGLWRGQLFWNYPDGNGIEPKEDADSVVNLRTDTHTDAHAHLCSQIQQKRIYIVVGSCRHLPLYCANNERAHM